MITLEKIDDGFLVKVEIQILDARMASSIRSTIMDQTVEGRLFALDLSQVKLIDSGGIAKLILLLRELKANGCSLALIGLTPSVKSTFSMTRMDRIFTLCDTLSDLPAQ